MTAEPTTRGQVWEVADMRVTALPREHREAGRITTRLDPEGWSVWLHRFAAGMRGGAELLGRAETREEALALAERRA